ncbi:nicotinate-nicotinamide nucleotide adenylyltransferase [Cyanobium sp.]|nr:nicotinate-nicotinamide nucleotide adenylyltransferase [Cyanobium sp.]
MSQPPLALFGTSADPPTAGHRALLAGLANHYGQVATWASDNPLKQHGAPLALRADLLQALVNDLADPRVELVQSLSSPRALETLERAEARWPQRPLVFVVGGDLAEQVPRWHRAGDLLRRCRLAVVPRQGYRFDPSCLEPLRQLGGTPELLTLPVPASASSAIREQPSPELVPPVLWAELVKHNLYGLGQPSSPPAR